MILTEGGPCEEFPEQQKIKWGINIEYHVKVNYRHWFPLHDRNSRQPIREV